MRLFTKCRRKILRDSIPHGQLLAYDSLHSQPITCQTILHRAIPHKIIDRKNSSLLISQITHYFYRTYSNSEIFIIDIRHEIMYINNKFSFIILYCVIVYNFHSFIIRKPPKNINKKKENQIHANKFNSIHLYIQVYYIMSQRICCCIVSNLVIMHK